VGHQSSNNSSGQGVLRCEHAFRCINCLGKWLDQYLHNIKPLKAKTKGKLVHRASLPKTKCEHDF